MVNPTRIICSLLIFGLFQTSCLDYPICAPDAFNSTQRFYSVDLNGEVSPLEKFTRSISYQSGSKIRVYGFDEINKIIYFTTDYISRSGEITALNYTTGESNIFIMDFYADNFTLSPNGEMFLYEKYLGDLRSEIYLVSLNDSLGTPVPKDSSFSSLRFPNWYSNNEIIYAANDGLYTVGLIDSTVTQIGNQFPFFGYDISSDLNTIVLSGYVDRNESNSQVAIYLKKAADSETSYFTIGTYPLLIQGQDKLIYETSTDIVLSDFEGNIKSIYAKKSTRSYSEFHQIALSPDGNQLAIAESDGIHLIDIYTLSNRKIVDYEDFISDQDRSDYTSIEALFNTPIFSSDGSTIFFSFTKGVYSDGC
jgi:hypothetical protein